MKKDLEDELELPSDEDENVGDGVPKKKIKRKKSKEERAAERKVVFWTLIIVLGATVGFWLWPKVRDFSLGVPVFKIESPMEDNPSSGWKNYVEYKL